MSKKRKNLLRLSLAFAISFPSLALAHEAYVLPQPFFWNTVKEPVSLKVFDALKNPHDLGVSVIIVSAVVVFIILNFLFRLTARGTRFHGFFERFVHLGPMFVRIAIAAAFFFGAKSGAFLGPELPIAQMPFAELTRWALYASSFMILFGVLTETAAVVGLIVFTVGFFVFGGYLATYLNYLGELVALALFGMRRWSVDGRLFGPLRSWRAKWELYETTIVRVCYGLALIYAGITVKLLHPALTMKVVNDWNLAQFHWLFPSDPLLVTLGAGFAEIAIGLFIILGFEMRVTVFISLFYVTLSLFYFRELVWPHILLYGISLNLIVQPEVLTFDHLIFKKERAQKSIWRRLISSHKAA